MVCDNDVIFVFNFVISVDFEGIYFFIDIVSLVFVLRGFDRYLVNRLISGLVNCFSMFFRCFLVEEKR